jgi:hypothetical protein
MGSFGKPPERVILGDNPESLGVIHHLLGSNTHCSLRSSSPPQRAITPKALSLVPTPSPVSVTQSLLNTEPLRQAQSSALPLCDS